MSDAGQEEDPDKKRFDPGPNKVWDTDKDFKNLANTPGIVLFKLSYYCASDYHDECDGKIYYSFKKFSHREFNLKTGKETEVYEDFVWDYKHASVQLAGGETQTPFNTPSGSKCECHCHRLPGYKEMLEAKMRENPPTKSVGRIHISPYDQKELDPEIRDGLK